MAQGNPKKYHIRRRLNNSSCKNRLDYTCFQNILPFILDSLSHGLIITDLNASIIYANRAIERITGYTGSELMGKSPDLLNGEEISMRIKQNQRWQGELRQRRKDGEVYWAELEVFPVPDNNGNVVAWASIQFDKTIRKEAEILEKDSQETTRMILSDLDSTVKALQEKDLILSSISEIVSFQDIDMRIRWANVMASETLNIPIDQMIGRHCYEVWQDSNRPCLSCPVKETLESGEKASGEISTPGGAIWQIKSFPVKDDNNNVIGTVEIAKDITERKKMESEMARFDRMNLIGEMATSFGHEIRNPMTVIKGFLQLLYDKDGIEPYRNYFQIMIEEVDSANAIITEYLSLANNKVIDLKSQSLNLIIEGIYPLILADAIREDKVIELELKDIPFIVIDKNDIHQLILNLVRNGLEAVSKGGVLTIMTYQDGKEVVLAIKDQGKGIEPSIISKLGMPFITTKENGVGIGLAICYSIVDRNNAQIGFETSSEGTTFYVRFPFDTASGAVIS